MVPATGIEVSIPAILREMKAARRLVHRRREIRQQLGKCLHDRRIERFAGVLLEHPDRRLRRDRASVRPFGRDGVEAVDDGQDSRANRNVGPAEAHRISRPIPALVMTSDDGSHGARKRDGLDDLGADLRVNLHLLALVRGQRAWLREDVLGNRKLADVVQERGDLDGVRVRLGQFDGRARFVA